MAQSDLVISGETYIIGLIKQLPDKLQFFLENALDQHWIKGLQTYLKPNPFLQVHLPSKFGFKNGLLFETIKEYILGLTLSQQQTLNFVLLDYFTVLKHNVIGASWVEVDQICPNCRCRVIDPCLCDKLCSSCCSCPEHN